MFPPPAPSHGSCTSRRPSTTSAATLQGSVSFIARPDAAQMAAYTEQVRAQLALHARAVPAARRFTSDSVIPAKVGDPCPIKYVLYIIKENRTYDQVFGDFRDANGQPAGNGDPNLTMYGESVTPNQHQTRPRLRAARQPVLQRRSQRGRPQLVRRGHRHRFQPALLDHLLLRARQTVRATTKWKRRPPAISGTCAGATA